MIRLAPKDAPTLLGQGATLVDVREADEHARARIPGALNRPLSRLGEAPLPGAAAVIFHCRSGARTAAHAERLSAAAMGRPTYVLDGGLDAWRGAGLPVAEDRGQPIEIMRQVQIAAGSLVVLGVLGGVLVSPWLLALAGFVGAGLVFAGVSGTCGMAALLRRMPWNRA